MKHIHVSPTIPFTSEIPSEKVLESFVSLHRCYETGGDNVEKDRDRERERQTDRQTDRQVNEELRNNGHTQTDVFTRSRNVVRIRRCVGFILCTYKNSRRTRARPRNPSESPQEQSRKKWGGGGGARRGTERGSRRVGAA